MLFRSCKRSKNEGKPFCVIAFDIDGFRQINHEYGYQDANHILLSVVEQVNETIRPEDQFIRRHRSGDEFIVFAFNNNLTRGEYTANRIRERLEKYEKFSVRVNKVPVRITISAGVAECNVNNEESLDDVLRRVDEALKVAKSKKNSVERNETYESKPKKQLVV